MIRRFQNKERAYEEWRAANAEGFVFNHFEGDDPRMNVVHRVRCTHLSRAKDQGARTVIEKVCANGRAELEEFVMMLRRGPGGWTRCGVCMR